MRHFLLIPVAFVALAIPVAVFAAGGEGGFNGVVHSIENRYHVHASHIPFLGLVSLISRGATHGGVGGLHIAEFDSFDEPVDGNELNRMVEEKLGAGWERTIRETSKKGNEQTLIFTHADGDRMALLVVTVEDREMNVVQVSVDPKHLDGDIVQYSHHHRDQDPGSEEHSD